MLRAFFGGEKNSQRTVIGYQLLIANQIIRGMIMPGN